MDTSNWDLHCRCQQSIWLFLFVLTDFCFFDWLQCCWSCMLKADRKQTQIRRAKAGQTLAELLHNVPPRRTTLRVIAGPYLHGLVTSGRAFAWLNSQTSSAAWILKGEGETLTLRAKGLADLGWDLPNRWGSSPVFLTVAQLDEGSAQM